MEKKDKDPSAYLESLPETDREPMKRLDRLISDIMAEQPRTLWEGTFWGGSDQTIIGYGDLAAARSGQGPDWFMVGLALQKNYISMYVNAVEDGQYVLERYKARLGKVKVGKASVSFKSIEDVDLDTLAEVVGIARDQLAQSQATR